MQSGDVIRSFMSSIRQSDVEHGHRPEKIFVNGTMMHIIDIMDSCQGFYDKRNLTFMGCSLQEYSDGSDLPEYYIASERGQFYEPAKVYF